MFFGMTISTNGLAKAKGNALRVKIKQVLILSDSVPVYIMCKNILLCACVFYVILTDL